MTARFSSDSGRNFPCTVQVLARNVMIKYSNLGPGVMRESMTNAAFEGKYRKKMKKPHFLFGGRIGLSEDCLFDGNYKWLR